MPGTGDLPSHVLGRQVKLWRWRRRLTGQALTERIREVGGNIGRMPLSKIETGDRGVSVNEWLTIAYALRVPPPLLLCDLEAGTPVNIVPSEAVHPWLAYEWIRGDQPPVTSDGKVVGAEEFGEALTAITLYRDERAAANAVHDAQTEITAAEYAGNGDRLKAARSQHYEALQRLAGVLDQMVEHEIVPPQKPAAWLDLMQQLKLLKYPEAVAGGVRQETA